MKKILSLIAVLSLSIGLCTGCKKTLEAGGAYSPVVTATNVSGTIVTTTRPDIGLYTADSGFVAAYSLLDLAFRFEKDNRAALWKLSPSIKHTLDSIRPGANTAVESYKAARKAYLANPSPAGLDLMNSILAKIQQVASAASAAVASATTTPAK